MYVILFNPGSAGDLVSAVIDSKNASISDQGHVVIPDSRALLKQSDEIGEEVYIKFLNSYNEISAEYNSAPSHLYRFHMSHNHNIIFIEYDNEDWLAFTKSRIDKLYVDKVDSIDSICTIDSLKHVRKHTALGIETKTDKILYVSDIFEGRLIEKLSQWVDTPLNEAFYLKWLNQPINKINI